MHIKLLLKNPEENCCWKAYIFTEISIKMDSKETGHMVWTEWIWFRMETCDWMWK